MVAQQANQAAARSLRLGGEGVETQGYRHLRGEEVGQVNGAS